LLEVGVRRTVLERVLQPTIQSINRAHASPVVGWNVRTILLFKSHFIARPNFLVGWFASFCTCNSAASPNGRVDRDLLTPRASPASSPAAPCSLPCFIPASCHDNDPSGVSAVRANAGCIEPILLTFRASELTATSIYLYVLHPRLGCHAMPCHACMSSGKRSCFQNRNTTTSPHLTSPHGRNLSRLTVVCLQYTVPSLTKLPTRRVQVSLPRIAAGTFHQESDHLSSSCSLLPSPSQRHIRHHSIRCRRNPLARSQCGVRPISVQSPTSTLLFGG
jgi:hypothetical protein